MGYENKLLLPLNGDLVINRICYTVLNSGMKPVIVVTGFQHTEIEKALPELIDQIAHNPNWEKGMAGSVHTGMSLLPDTVDGNMIVLGDMPMLSKNTLDLLIDEFNVQQGNHIIYPIYKQRQANPVIFPKKYFQEILSTTGDRGCKKVLKQYPDDAVGVSIGFPEVVFDCDNEDDYFRLLEEMQEFDVKT